MMKKLTYLSAILALAVFTTFSACKKKDDPDEPVNQVFAFTFSTVTGFVSGDVTLNTGEQFKVGLIANSATGSTLSQLVVTRIFNDKPDVVFDTALTLTSINYEFHGISRDEPGVESWIFMIKQSDSSELTKSFNITTESSVGLIATYDQRIIGAQQSITGSSFASSTGQIFDLGGAKANASVIDWLYYFGSASFATIASPDDATAASVFTDGGTIENPGPNALVTWGVRNATRFRTIKDPIDWDAIQDDTELLNLTQGATDLLAPDLKAGYYVAFITAAGKKGLIRVNGISQEEDGTMDISVKVQQ